MICVVVECDGVRVDNVVVSFDRFQNVVDVPVVEGPALVEALVAVVRIVEIELVDEGIVVVVTVAPAVVAREVLLVLRVEASRMASEEDLLLGGVAGTVFVFLWHSDQSIDG